MIGVARWGQQRSLARIFQVLRVATARSPGARLGVAGEALDQLRGFGVGPPCVGLAADGDRPGVVRQPPVAN